MIRTSQGLSSNRPMKKASIALTAPTPSKTAPKAIAAKMIHMNMQLTPRDLRMVFSITWRVSRSLTRAASVAAVAPTAELSVGLV